MGKQTVGYKYKMGLHFGICHGPVDALLEIRVGDRTAWAGELTSSGTIAIFKPELFGGDEREGGIEGSADVMFGEPLQLPNSYLKTLYTGLMPAFRGLLGVVFKGGQVSSNNPYIKPWSFKVRRIHGGWGEGPISTEQVLSGPVLFPWIDGGTDPRNCQNDHLYYSAHPGAPTRNTLDEALADAAAYLGVPVNPSLLGFTGEDRRINGYGYSEPVGEDKTIQLHFLHTVPTKYIDSLEIGGFSSAMHYLYQASIVEDGEAFFFNGNGTFSGLATIRPGMCFIDRFDTDYGGLPPGGWQHLNNGRWYERGSTEDRFWVALYWCPTVQINVVRKIRAPDNPCAPRCTPAWPDWEEDPEHYCVIDGDTLQEKITWTQISGSFKVLAYYRDNGSIVAQYPLNPVLAPTDPNYNNEAYWTALYNAAVTAGDIAAGKTYSSDGGGNSGTFPRKITQTYRSSEITTIGSNVWEPDLARIGDDMNPAHILYQCATNAEWSMGWPAAMMGDSFLDAAQKLYDEGFGLSFFWSKQVKIEDFAQVVLDHIAGVLYTNPRTGQFELKLIRDDYDPDTLEVFDESNILELQSFQRAGYGETVNEVIVIYTDPDTGKDVATVPLPDLANIQAQGAVLTRKINFPGIRVPSLALRVGERELIAGSTPMAKGKILVDRSAWDVVPGDVRKFSWPPLDIEGLVIRVLDVKRGSLTDGSILIDFSEDVWGLPENSYAQEQPNESVDPSAAPVDLENRVIEEASYIQLRRQFSDADMDYLPDDAGYLSTAAVRASGDNIDYGISTYNGSDYLPVGRGDFCPSGTLFYALGYPDDSGLNDIVLENVVDGDLVEVGRYALLGTELVRVDAWDEETGEATIGRGVLDSCAAQHAIGARLYFLDSFTDSDGVQRIDGETLQVKLLPKTTQGELDVDDATAETVEFDQRQFRPYPPGKPRINTELYPTSIFEADLVFDWVHRDRLQQNLEGEETGSIGPEDGTTYKVRLVDDATETEMYMADGISGETHTVSPSINGNYTLRLEISSVRDGLESRQKQTHIFDYVNGNYRSLEEDGFNRISESGLDRILED